MEHITENKTFPRPALPELSLPVPLYLRCVFALLSGFIILVISAQSLARKPAVLHTNPFSEFVDSFPEKSSRSDIEARGYTCPARGLSGGQHDYCMVYPDDGLFSRVGFEMVDGVIHHFNFIVRNHALRAGDLILIWGLPVIEVRGRMVRLRWRHVGIIAEAPAHSGKFTPALAVSNVAISVYRGHTR